jgi:uncharacterized protein (UPF0210 family)
MAPVLNPFLTDAKHTWDRAETVMGWFSQIVDTAYAYSDMIISHRQKKVDKEYARKQAEKTAYKILREQVEKKRNATAHAKREVTWISL